MSKPVPNSTFMSPSGALVWAAFIPVVINPFGALLQAKIYSKNSFKICTVARLIYARSVVISFYS